MHDTVTSFGSLGGALFHRFMLGHQQHDVAHHRVRFNYVGLPLCTSCYCSPVSCTYSQDGSRRSMLKTFHLYLHRDRRVQAVNLILDVELATGHEESDLP